MFGLAWSAPPAAVLRRFEGLSPAATEDHLLVYRLDSIAERLREEGAFCPAALLSGPDRHDEVVFRFGPAGLAHISVRFGYPFETIGYKPENLSDSAMALLARGEHALLLQDLAARYGAPAANLDQPARNGKLHLVSSALFCGTDGTVLCVCFGHDGGALAGCLSYRPPIDDPQGF